ncbi:MAG: efflux RND transporter periplasmic adaptor subunit [Limnohabitans sp.]
MKIKTRHVVIAVILLALLAGIWRALSARRAQQQSASAIATTQTSIEIAQSDVLVVQERNLTQTLGVSGTVKALNYAVIKAKVAGELKEVTVREGDRVNAGQVLARIDPIEYQQRWNQLKEQAAAAKSQLEIAQRQWDSNKALVDQGFISKIALDNSQASLQGAIASHRAAMAGADVARKALDDSVLVAPFAGVIAVRSAQPGERVGIDARVMELVDLSQLEIETPLTPSDSVDVRVGQTARIQIEDRPQMVSAKVKRISPSAQAGSRSVMVYLSLESPEGLRHGLFAKGQIQLKTVQALSLPLSAIRTDRAKPYVQVVEKVGETQQVVHKTVELGLRGIDAQQPETDTWVAVTGVSPNSQVLIGQVGSLREGLLVNFTQAAKTP